MSKNVELVEEILNLSENVNWSIGGENVELVEKCGIGRNIS